MSRRRPLEIRQFIVTVHTAGCAGPAGEHLTPQRTSVRLFCWNAVHSSRSKIVLDFHEGGSRPGSKSHEAAGIHQAHHWHSGCVASRLDAQPVISAVAHIQVRSFFECSPQRLSNLPVNSAGHTRKKALQSSSWARKLRGRGRQLTLYAISVRVARRLPVGYDSKDLRPGREADARSIYPGSQGRSFQRPH